MDNLLDKSDRQKSSIKQNTTDLSNDTKETLKEKNIPPSEYDKLHTKTVIEYKKNLNTTKENKAKLKNDVELNKKAKAETYGYNTSTFLKKEISKNSKGKDVSKYVSNGEKVTNHVLKQIKGKTDKFLNSTLSLDTLSNNQIGWMLSGVETLIQNGNSEYKNKIIEKLSSDSKGLIHLKNNWNGIAMNLQFDAKLMQPLLKDIIESASKAIDKKVISFLKENNSSITENEIQNILKEIKKDLVDGKDMSEMIKLLSNFQGQTTDDELSKFVLDLIKVEGVRKEFKSKKLETKIEDIKKSITNNTGNIEQLEEIQKKLKEEVDKNKIIRTKQSKQVEILVAVSESEALAKQLVRESRLGKTDIEISQSMSILAREEGLTEIANQLELTSIELIEIQKNIDEINEQEKKDEEKLIEKKKNKQTNNVPNNITNTQYTFNNTTDNTTIESKTGEKIKISVHQAKMIDNNPDIIDTIATLNTTLIKVGLPNIINYIDKISNAIGTTGGVDNNDKSLNSGEIQKFLNNILISVGKQSISETSTLEQYVNEFNTKNKVQISGNHEDNKEIGSSNIEEKFMKKYIVGFTSFKSSAFQNDIQKKS